MKAISAGHAEQGVVLNATGYIVAAHKIELAAKVIGKVKWIGVDKGDQVKEGQVLVRLEDDEYRAQLDQAKGNLANLEAHLAEAGARFAAGRNRAGAGQSELGEGRSGKRARQPGAHPQAGVAGGDVAAESGRRAGPLRFRRGQGEFAAEGLRPGEASARARRRSMPCAARWSRPAARVAYAETNLANTIIRAPVTGTILERAVEKGEFVTTSFVGDRGAKGYVVSLADLNDLEVELDISQNDFAKLHMGQKGIITTDAFPDRKYDGFIQEFSPEANRQKATVQVKVKVAHPDDYLRPEMNASVAFLSDEKNAAATPSQPIVIVPAAAIRDSKVFVVLDGRAVTRPVKPGPANSQGVRIEQGLIGGEDLIVNPPATLKDGDRVRQKV